MRHADSLIHATYARHLERLVAAVVAEEDALRRYLARAGGERKQRTRSPASGKGAAEERARGLPA